ncbi:hypothetical protein BJX68DRAFT_234654 [Aspergillus pseudodeflectus]|uniref:Uncharacterized protein n=1 Tax=Aspergillus pseudodeflectus TaxID=176178 RepID=A0ABR4KL20_9EURO
MCPMLLSSLRDGPTMILSPPQDHDFFQFPHQPKLDAAPSGAPFANTFGSHSFSSGVNSSRAPSFTGLATSSKPSRKRSRDDVAAEDFITERAPKLSPPVPARKEEQIYGEGMTLINPRTGMALSAESQTGTWYEERMETAMASAPAVSSQTHASSHASRKFQRLDPSAPGLDDIASSRIQRHLQENDGEDNRRPLNNPASSNPFSPEEPLVDDATRLLGISWQRVPASNDPDMAAALRGWKRVIDRQFSRHLVDAEILVKNRALGAYLVSARPIIPLSGPAQMPAFYLFKEDLSQGQLVASSWDSCMRNLQSTPISFEGTEVLNASDRPCNSVTTQNHNLLATSGAEPGLPLLQTLCALPVSTGVGMNGGMGSGMGMDIDV